MKIKKVLFIFVSLTYLLPSAKANFNLSPVIGYERVQKIAPTPHTTSRLIYGVRANYGPPRLSLEAELTQAKDDSSFPESNLKIDETAINGMIGVRSSYDFMNILNWHIRAGGHGRKVKQTRTENNLITVYEPSINLSPYAGTGLSVNLLNILTVNAGLTVIFTGEPRGSDRDYQATLGFGIRV